MWLSLQPIRILDCREYHYRTPQPLCGINCSWYLRQYPELASLYPEPEHQNLCWLVSRWMVTAAPDSPLKTTVVKARL